MSSPKEPAWFAPIMIVLVGGLAIYGMSRGSGSCPLIPSSSAPVESVAMSPAAEGSATKAVDANATLVHADENSFDEVVLKAQGPVLVDFYADWCGPCQRLAPVLERVSKDLTEGRIVKVNVDHNPQIAARYGIQALPTLLVFADGEVVEKTMGMQSEQDVRKLLQR